MVPDIYSPQAIRRPDGRNLSYCLFGPADGVSMVFFYGTPGTMYLSPDRLPLLAELRVRLLVMDRPGYGASTRQPGRSVATVTGDLAALADQLGWDRFAVWGGSGGGPHALACVARLGDRVVRCATAVCPAPFDAAGLDWFAGMSALNVEEFSRARGGEAAYRPLAERLAREAVAAAEEGRHAVSDDHDLPESDRALLAARSSAPGSLVRTRAMYTGGIDGCVDDMLAFTRPWDFSMADIRVPVSVWYGPDDVLCPRAHADWLLAHIPCAESHELSGGHLLGEQDSRQLYRWLLGAPAEGSRA